MRANGSLSSRLKRIAQSGAVAGYDSPEAVVLFEKSDVLAMRRAFRMIRICPDQRMMRE